jgi:hypothetical protein
MRPSSIRLFPTYYFLLVIPAIVNATFQGCSGASSRGDFCGWANAWDDFWDIRQAACDTTYTAGDGVYTINTNGWAGQAQQVLQPGDSNEHCWDAMNDIIWNCFNSDTGENGPDTTHYSGTWDNGKEWYWMWGNPADFGRRNKDGNCCESGSDCHGVDG